jgi:hypothetical protein
LRGRSVDVFEGEGFSNSKPRMLIRINSEDLVEEFCQTDREGKIVPAAKQTIFSAQIALDCQSSDKSIDLGFLAQTDIALGRLSAILADSHKIAVARAIAKQAAADLSRARSWDLYRSTNIFILDDPALPESQEEFVKEIALTSDLEKTFQDASKQHQTINAVFERAKDFLSSHINSIFHFRSQASAAARFLASCMRADGKPYMHAWNREKAAGLTRGTDDLGNRRKPNHPGYIAIARHLESILYSLHPPRFWNDYPPSPHDLSF